jgi:hypothetical protein
MVLNQDLVAAMVKLEGMTRRLEMAEREKDRINASLSESQVGAWAVVDAATSDRILPGQYRLSAMFFCWFCS